MLLFSRTRKRCIFLLKDFSFFIVGGSKKSLHVYRVHRLCKSSTPVENFMLLFLQSFFSGKSPASSGRKEESSGCHAGQYREVFWNCCQVFLCIPLRAWVFPLWAVCSDRCPQLVFFLRGLEGGGWLGEGVKCDKSTMIDRFIIQHW